MVLAYVAELAEQQQAKLRQPKGRCRRILVGGEVPINLPNDYPLRFGVWVDGNLYFYTKRQGRCYRRRFATGREATEAAISMMQKLHMPALFVPYRCPLCKHWHFGHEVGA